MYSKISTPYKFTNDEIKIIQDNFTSHDDWTKPVFDGIKGNIIDYLRIKQKNKCCYCRWELGFDIKEVDIEHIIPKSEYSQFTFHAKNLALSCPGCNTSKGKKKVLFKSITYYPRTGSNIKIIHPHFDNYYNSVEIHDGAVYEGLDDKGCETIKKCKLYRLKKVLKKKQEIATKDTRIKQLVEALRTASQEDRVELAAAINELIGGA